MNVLKWFAVILFISSPGEFGLCINHHPRDKTAQIVITGDVVDIQRREEKSYINFIIHLNLKITNVGAKPALFYLKDCNYSVREWLAKTVVDMEADNFTLHSQSWGSVELTKEWSDLRLRLAESQEPPPDLISTLSVGEELSYPLKCYLQIPRTSFNNGTRMMYGWEIYGEYSRLWLKIEMMTWPPNLEEPNAAWPEGPLAKKLYKRWKDYGVLWYTFIKSEPIPIQLDKATMEK